MSSPTVVTRAPDARTMCLLCQPHTFLQWLTIASLLHCLIIAMRLPFLTLCWTTGTDGGRLTNNMRYLMASLLRHSPSTR